LNRATHISDKSCMIIFHIHHMAQIVHFLNSATNLCDFMVEIIDFFQIDIIRPLRIDWEKTRWLNHLKMKTSCPRCKGEQESKANDTDFRRDGLVWKIKYSHFWRVNVNKKLKNSTSLGNEFGEITATPWFYFIGVPKIGHNYNDAPCDSTKFTAIPNIHFYSLQSSEHNSND